MKIIIKLACVAVLFAAIPFYSFAQNNFKAGYIVTPKGDTVKGFIDYGEWNTNPTAFKFKPGTNSQPQKINVSNAIAVGVDGLDYFEKNIVSISMDQVEISKISTGVDTTKIIDTVFLWTLSKGKYVSLYSYNDGFKTRFYYTEKGIAGAHEFSYHIFYPVGDPTHFIEIKSEEQLSYLANKYKPTVINQVRGVRYNKSDFLKIINLINGDDGSKQFKSESKSSVSFFVGAGASSSELKFKSYPALDHPDYNKIYVLPYITGGVNLYPNKITQKLLIKFQLSFVPDQHEIHSVQNDYANLTTETTQKFKQYSLGISPQIIYNFYTGPALKIYAGTGATVNISMYKDNQYIVHANDGITNPTNITQHINFDSLWAAVPISAGIVVNNKIDLNFYYFVPATFTTYSGISSNVSSYRAGINYLF